MRTLEKIRLKIAWLSINEIQKFVTISEGLTRKGVTLDDLLLILEDERKKFEATEIKCLPSLARCPDCNTPLQIRAVNTGPGDVTGDPSDKTVRLCPNKGCLYTEYSPKTIAEWQKEIITEIANQNR